MAWMYDDKWKRQTRGGQYLPRLPMAPPPCFKCPKAGGSDRPAPEKDMTERSWAAYLHYVECKAIGEFPDDPIVRRNAGHIRWVEDCVERSQASGLAGLITVLARK